MVDDADVRAVNSSNPQRGADFEQLTSEVLAAEFGHDLVSSLRVPIGSPAKQHRFDLGSEEHQVIVECKNHSWTKTNNVPSAKITTLREAVLFLTLGPAGYRRVLAMKRQCHPDRVESLAEYFVRLNVNLLGDIEVVEISEDGHVAWLTPRRGVVAQ